LRQYFALIISVWSAKKSLIFTLGFVLLFGNFYLFPQEGALESKASEDLENLRKNSPDPIENSQFKQSTQPASIQARSYGTKRLKTPSDYSKKISDLGYENFSDVDWIVAGVDSRVRYEYRENDFRRNDIRIDRPFLLRNRAFLSLENKLDPFRFTVEVEDAQIIQSVYTATNRDENRSEPIQAYLELYFDNWCFLSSYPLSIKAGRMAFELVDRRLFAKNEWRNTTNTFQGTRATLGQDSNLWNLDIFYLIPLSRIPLKLDEKEKKTEFFGGVFTYNVLEKNLQIQTYFLGLLVSEESNYDLDSKNRLKSNIQRAGKRINTSGIRFFGYIGDSGFDYDVNWVEQSGSNDIGKGIDQRARSIIFDFGYTWQLEWKPRLGILYANVSGDDNPKDQVNQRLDRLYGFARPWSSSDYITMENIRSSKIVFEFIPFKDSKIDTAYNRYLLQSPTDRWDRPNKRDEDGKSGTHIGDEWNFRWITKIAGHFNLNVGYAYFKPGEFAINQTQRVDPSHFVYVELSTIFF
jgi:hypothetical protein